MYRAVKHYFFAITGTPSILKIIKTHRAKQKPSVNRPTLASRITSRVVWLNVFKGYGYIQGDNTDVDIIVHHLYNTKNNPIKFFKSLAQSGVIQFEVVMSTKISHRLRA